MIGPSCCKLSLLCTGTGMYGYDVMASLNIGSLPTTLVRTTADSLPQSDANSKQASERPESYRSPPISGIAFDLSLRIQLNHDLSSR